MPDLSVPIIELDGVAASNAGFRILENASAKFYAGEVAVVMGSAGSGKSTLLKVAAGLMVPDEGQVNFLGTSIASFNQEEELRFRQRCSFVFQDAALWANTNLLQNLLLPLRVHKPWMAESEMKKRVMAIFDKVGYTESVTLRPAELSSGEQKLVSIARALVLDPELVFMDDPTSHLDEDSRERVFGIIEELKQQNRTVIVVTNNSELAFRHADRLGIVKNGSVPLLGPYNDVVRNEAHEFVGIVSRLRSRGVRNKAIDEQNKEM